MDTFVPGEKVKAKRGSNRIMVVLGFIEEDGELTGYKLLDGEGRNRFYRHDDLKPAYKKKKKRRRRKS